MPNYKQPTPEEEKISQELDELYPRIKSGTIVDYKGGCYQMKYFPVAKSDDGVKVKEWGHRWVPIKGR